MVFYYDIAQGSSSDVTSLQNLFSIYRRACTTNPAVKCNGQTVSWSALTTSAETHYGSSNPAWWRFDDTGWNTGVAHF
jgi:hypothetical protein